MNIIHKEQMFLKRQEYNKNMREMQEDHKRDIAIKASILVERAAEINSISPTVGLIQMGFTSWDAHQILEKRYFEDGLDLTICEKYHAHLMNRIKHAQILQDKL